MTVYIYCLGTTAVCDLAGKETKTKKQKKVFKALQAANIFSTGASSQNRIFHFGYLAHRSWVSGAGLVSDRPSTGYRVGDASHTASYSLDPG